MTDDIPVNDAPVFKTMVSDGSGIFPVDTIEYQGKLWLVLRWLFPPSREWREPERIICISNLRIQDLRKMQNMPADFSLSVPLPKVLFDPIAKLPIEQYLVIEHPQIRFRMPSEKLN